MKAIQLTAYGDSSVLKLVELEQPVPSGNQVLVKIAATTINPFDIKVRSGAMKDDVPVHFPFIPGSDFAGTIEEVGEKVTRLKKGDKVFGIAFGGTYAEYRVLPEKNVSLMPVNVTFNEAAALAVPLNTAYSILIEAGKVHAGQKILVHGASGAVGSAVVQLAKYLGAYVIGTASGKGIEHVKSLGIDEAIDYKLQDFSTLVSNLDIVLDLVGGAVLQKSYPLIKKGGKLISIVMPVSSDEAKKYGISAEFVDSVATLEKLSFGKKLVENGKIKAQVSRVMPLEEAAAAQDLLNKGGINGKVVLSL